MGQYRWHLRPVGVALAERAGLMDALLPRHLSGCRWQRESGARSCWVTGPDGLHARFLAEAARAEGVLIEPGYVFFEDSAQGRACFRVGFSAIRTRRIREGLTKFGQMVVF